ncbi:MAG TPA: hypothetical protein VER98_06245, partial [Terriglobia bacterium]|nr:hypothetical protein [Terriglobia bacterium]
NVKRSTIKLDTYQQLQVEMRGRGLRANSDLILGLPGESLKTHLDALHKLLDSGIDQMHNFQAMMLKGAELETIKSREQFGFETRFRVLPKNFGVYGGEAVLDVEKIIVGTDTLPFEDYVNARKFHLASSVFWNDSWFDVVVRFVRAWGIKSSEWWNTLLPAMENGNSKTREFLDLFVTETINELFETPEECVAFYSRPANFARLQKGEIGDNLMYKYRALASFFLWPEVCQTLMDATRGLLERQGIAGQIPEFDEFWADFGQFVRLQHADGETIDAVLRPVTVPMTYDIARWLTDGNLKDPSPYRLAVPREFTFQLPAECARELEGAFKVWGSELKALSKLVTRIKIGWQVRECSASVSNDRGSYSEYKTLAKRAG